MLYNVFPTGTASLHHVGGEYEVKRKMYNNKCFLIGYPPKLTEFCVFIKVNFQNSCNSDGGSSVTIHAVIFSNMQV